jgi:hypothetical protein
MPGKTYIMGTAWYPADKAPEAGKILVKAMATPMKFIKSAHLYGTSTEAGIKVVTIYQIENEKLADGFREIAKIYYQYCSIPGFRFQIEMMVTGVEALAMMGLRAPTK